MAQNYEQKHPGYTAARLAREMAMDLYEGGKRVENNPQYLLRHPYETERQYEIRLKRATYRNFAAPIVDVFASYICDRRPARTLPKELEPLVEDVDRNQTSANVFFANQARLAAACGTSFVLCDMEPARGKSRAEDKLQGRRSLPYFVAIDPDNVFDWCLDERGLVWCVIYGVENLPGEPFAQAMCRDTLTVWTRSSWQRLASPPRAVSQFVQAADEGLLTNMAIVGEGGHNLGEVPLVPLCFEPVDMMRGNPATDDVLSLILRVYRRDSELDKMLFDCAVPLGIINGLSIDDKDAFVRSSSNILVSSSHPGISGMYLEPSGHSYQALRESLGNDIQSIREIALRMVRPNSAQAISAESKSIDKQQLDTQLANFARRCANSERKCFELAFKWLHGNVASPDIRTPYNEDYSLGEMEKLDRTYLLQMFQAGAIEQDMYLELLKRINVLGAEFEVPQKNLDA